ncbi:MAG TPA: hypothetical protein VLN59_05140 [Burkholderiales bacterium]|nr:hypothetical protein [Burkholderiales bacterium]
MPLESPEVALYEVARKYQGKRYEDEDGLEVRWRLDEKTIGVIRIDGHRNEISGDILLTGRVGAYQGRRNSAATRFGSIYAGEFDTLGELEKLADGAWSILGWLYQRRARDRYRR